MPRCRFNILCGAISLALLAAASVPAAGDEQVFRFVRAGATNRLSRVLASDGIHAATSTASCAVTPLHVAAALDRTTSAALLIHHGARVDARTNGGFTPLHWAAGRDAAATLNLLLAHGADPSATSRQGITPLHWAAARDATNAVRRLLALEHVLEARTDGGFTPLHWAVREDADTVAIEMAAVALERDVGERVVGGFEHLPLSGDTTRPFLLTDERPDQPDSMPLTHPEPSADTNAVRLVLPNGESIELLYVTSLALWAGKYEVTNGQFRQFRPHHDSGTRDGFSLNADDQPVVRVTWTEADAFCAWASRLPCNGAVTHLAVRLPTTTEWEVLAACGRARIYPWGNAWPPDSGNYYDVSASNALEATNAIVGYEDGFPVACPVSKSGASKWGIYGLGGNAWEWCRDWYDVERTYRTRRGGSWDFNPTNSLRLDFIGFDRPDAAYDTIGFRVVGESRDPRPPLVDH